ncbi:P63C domain-containing protein [uncultured Enterovirga sp.]|uniref:P63C domain-containing protein n=1 Tax=uncultured Enterovirga sp. TaxID=2026352 RepID=UPI0035CBA2EB
MDADASGKAKGGHARAAKLSPEKRSEIARKAAAQRWAGALADDTPRVLESFKSKLNIAGAEIPCAVVMGPAGVQRVLSETGITNAVLGDRSGASKRKKKASAEGGAPLPIFVAPNQLLAFITTDLREGPLKPIDYLDGERLVRGYDASVLAAVCNVWLKAREAGALQDQQLDKAMKAEILTRALAETGIVALVDEATGYQAVRPQNALQSYLELVIRRELAAWAKKFPDEFYINIYRLKGWVWPGMSKNRYSVVANYTTNLIYDRLGPGITEELIQKTPKNDKGYRPNKLHQWLSDDIGDPMLATHMHSILMFQRLAIANGYGWKRFLHMVDQVLPRRGSTLELPLEFNDPSA